MSCRTDLETPVVTQTQLVEKSGFPHQSLREKKMERIALKQLAELTFVKCLEKLLFHSKCCISVYEISKNQA